jgi:hypothetical protein
LYFGRFAVVHIGGPSSNQAASLESQQIQQIQLLFGRTLTMDADAAKGCEIQNLVSSGECF